MNTPFRLIAILCLLTLLPFAPFFRDFNWVLLYRDLSDSMIPAKAFWLDGILTEGRVPRWNSLQMGGVPFYADLVGAPLYPLNFLFLLFGAERIPQALTLYIILHYPLMFLGWALLLRILRHPWRVALPIALCASWCGYAISANNLTHILSGITALPWFSFFWLRVLRNPSLRNLLGASFFLALPIYGGDPQFTYVMALGSLLYSLKRGFHSLKQYAALGALTVLCASAQLLPTLELLKHSVRADAAASAWGDMWSLTPLRLADFMFPNFFGSVGGRTDFWGFQHASVGKDTFFIHSLYMGIVPLFLLVWAACSGFALRRFRTRPRQLWIPAALLLLFFLPMGSFAPINVNKIFSAVLPLWASFRYPERLSIYFMFAILLVSAGILRAHFLAVSLSRTGKWRTSIAASVSVLMISSAVFYWHFHSMPTAGRPQIHLILLAGLAAILFMAAPRIRSKAWGTIGIWLLLILCDFLPYFPRNVWFQSAGITDSVTYPATKKILDDLTKNSAGFQRGFPNRLFSINSYAMPWESRIPAWIPIDPISYGVIAHWEGMAANIPSFHKIPSIQGMFSLEQIRPLMMIGALKSESLSELLNVFGVRYLLERFADRPPEVKLNLDAYPNFFIAREVVPVKGIDEVIRSFAQLKGKKAAVLLEDALPARPPSRIPETILESRDSARVEFRLEGEGDASVFVWNESFYPSWHAFLDGHELPVRRANGWSMAVELPELAAGAHRLEFRFDEKWIRAGQALTLTWFAILLFACFRVRAHAAGRTRRAP